MGVRPLAAPPGSRWGPLTAALSPQPSDDVTPTGPPCTPPVFIHSLAQIMPFFNSLNDFIIVALQSVKSNIWVIWGSVSQFLIFLLFLAWGHFFLFLCLPGVFKPHAGHCGRETRRSVSPAAEWGPAPWVVRLQPHGQALPGSGSVHCPHSSWTPRCPQGLLLTTAPPCPEHSPPGLDTTDTVRRALPRCGSSRFSLGEGTGGFRRPWVPAAAAET